MTFSQVPMNLWTRKRTASPPQLNARFAMSVVFKLGCGHPRTLRDLERDAGIDRCKEIHFQTLNFHLHLFLKLDLPRNSRQVILFHFPFHRGSSPTWQSSYCQSIKTSKAWKEEMIPNTVIFKMASSFTGKQSTRPCLWLVTLILSMDFC